MRVWFSESVRYYSHLGEQPGDTEPPSHPTASYNCEKLCTGPQRMGTRVLTGALSARAGSGRQSRSPVSRECIKKMGGVKPIDSWAAIRSKEPNVNATVQTDLKKKYCTDKLQNTT